MKRLLCLLIALLCFISVNAQGSLSIKSKAKPQKVSYDGPILTEADVMPTFPGGFVALNHYFRDNVIFPENAKKQRITGKVYVSFVVEKDGTITDVRIKKDIGYGCGKEVRRLVEAMPKWERGIHNNVPQRVLISLPVWFGNGTVEVDTY